MRIRVAAVAAALCAGGLGAAPAQAYLPSVCNVVGTATESRAMVGYAPGARAAASRAVAAYGGTVVGGVHEVHALQVSFGTAALREVALPALASAPGVRWAEPERTFAAHRKPNDPYLPLQWGLPKVGAPKAWDREVGTRNAVVVAILDTGVSIAHPDLAGRVTPGPDIVNDDDSPNDDHGHGTHVAGIVGARTNNRLGVAGMSWGARLLAVKVLGANGNGSDCDVVLGMVRAADAGARVLNLSLGSPGICGVATQLGVDYARDAGAVVVASAGNDALNGNPESAPANCDGVLAVGATDQNDRPAKFSSHHAYVDVAAPGVGIVSTGWDAKRNRNVYMGMSGTSMAAPLVSGLAALLLSRNPTWTPDQVADRIVRTADDRGARGRDEWFGSGRVNAARALG